MIFSIFTFDYLSLKLDVIPRFITWTPEIISIVALILIVIVISSQKTRIFNMLFLICFMYVLYLSVNIIASKAPPENIFLGMRNYLKHLPFFLFPFVLNIDNQMLKKQLIFVFIFILLQTPIAIAQRIYFDSIGMYSGDFVEGTCMWSGTLSIILISTFTFIYTMYLSKKLSLFKFIILLLYILFPTTINESKITLLLLPMSIIVVTFITSGISYAKKILIPITSFVLFMAIFIPIYNYYIVKVDAPTLQEIIINKNNYFQKYLYRDDSMLNPWDDHYVGRYGIIKKSFEKVTHDMITLLTGYGLGSATLSYLDTFKTSTETELSYSTQLAFTHILIEIGILGILFYFIFWVVIVISSWSIHNENNYFGMLSRTWLAVSIIFIIIAFYTNSIDLNALNYLFWYFSGVLVSHSYFQRSNYNKLISI